MDKGRIIILNEEGDDLVDNILDSLSEFDVGLGKKEDDADLFLKVEGRKFVLIKDDVKDVLNLNCKFFNFDNRFYKDGARVERRENVAIVLRNSRGEVMCLNWNNEKKWKSLVSGGIEENDIVQSGVDEVREEAGYVNVRFVREIDCEVRDKFYAPHKDVNRYLISRLVVFDLIDEEREELDNEELVKHVPVWVKEEEVLDFLSIENHKFLFREYLGEEQEYDSLVVLVRDMMCLSKDI